MRNISETTQKHSDVGQIYSFQIRDLIQNSLNALFTKFLTPGLTRELGNPMDDLLV